MAPWQKAIKQVHEKVHETFDFTEIESVMIYVSTERFPKRRWSRFEQDRIRFQEIFFHGKSADASQTKREEGPAERRLNQNLPRFRWSRRQPM